MKSDLGRRERVESGGQSLDLRSIGVRIRVLKIGGRKQKKDKVKRKLGRLKKHWGLEPRVNLPVINTRSLGGRESREDVGRERFLELYAVFTLQGFNCVTNPRHGDLGDRSSTTRSAERCRSLRVSSGPRSISKIMARRRCTSILSWEEQIVSTTEN